MTNQLDCVVIGAGVVGLAVARALALSGRDTLVLEEAAAIGTGISSRNSEVIHAGIYYPPGFAKSRLCVEGRQLLYEYCERHGVAFQRCGKLIVATDQTQLAALAALEASARNNGVRDLEWLSAAQALALEPALRCVAALRSPATGIIDSHGLMQALQADLERAGGMIALRAPLRRARRGEAGMRLEVGADEVVELTTSVLVNSAGLNAPEVARCIEGLPPATIPPQRLAKGNYFVLAGSSPFRHLVYPLPEGSGLGVHLTLDLAGRARFGPDVEWVERLDYSVDPSRAERFYGAIRRYWPDLPEGALLPGYAGIRPKLHGPREAVADFLIQAQDAHGVRGLVNLYGIESPGLTAALAIAAQVCRLV